MTRVRAKLSKVVTYCEKDNTLFFM